jgi:hypothetical protein
MPRASALAPQAVSGVRSLFITRGHKVDNSTDSEDVVSQPVSNSLVFLEFLIFLLPLCTARGRLRAEQKKRIQSHLFQILFHLELSNLKITNLCKNHSACFSRVFQMICSCQTDIKYPCCLPGGESLETGENQERENLPKTACIDFHLDFFTQRACK